MRHTLKHTDTRVSVCVCAAWRVSLQAELQSALGEMRRLSSLEALASASDGAAALLGLQMLGLPGACVLACVSLKC